MGRTSPHSRFTGSKERWCQWLGSRTGQGVLVKRKKYVVLAGIRTPYLPARSPGSISTELTRIQGTANMLRLKDTKSAAIITIFNCGPPTPYTIATSLQVRCKWNCAQICIRLRMWSTVCVYTRQSRHHRNPMGCSTTDPPPVFSPSNFLPPASSPSAFIAERK